MLEKNESNRFHAFKTPTHFYTVNLNLGKMYFLRAILFQCCGVKVLQRKCIIDILFIMNFNFSRDFTFLYYQYVMY